jgi:AcrR family transcriptional regulator
LLEAAVASYTEGGSFSVREVAQRAGVNHGQIHHLFGGKDGLVRAMLEHLADELVQSIRGRADGADVAALLGATVEAAVKDPRYVRVLARWLVEQPADEVPQGRFPVMDQLLAAFQAEPTSELKQALALGLAQSLGWVFFAPYIRRAVKLDAADEAALEQQLCWAPSVPAAREVGG